MIYNYYLSNAYLVFLDILKRLGYIFGMLALYGHFCLAVAQPLKLDYGVNRVDINADGVDDMIVRTRWDVYSAHSADQYVVAMAYLGQNGSLMPNGFYNVGFEDDEHDTLGRMVTSEGADCILSAYQFRLNKKKILEVDYIHRDFGKSYGDSQPIRITTYKVMNRQSMIEFGGIGYTPMYFKKLKERKTLKKYCDVNDFLNH